MNLSCNISLANKTINSSDGLNQSTLSNYSACSKALVGSEAVINPYEDFNKAAFGSAIFIIVVSLATILANGLLLFIFYVDPLKIFRNPTTYFLIGLAIVDLLTALVPEPIYATCFILLYFQHPARKKCIPFMDAGRYFGAATMTASFLIVFAFTMTQYIVVSSPLKYGRLVTKTKVLITVTLIYVYSATFWCLHLMGVPPNVQEKLDLFMHSYLMAIITIVFYIILHFAMRKKMAEARTLQNEAGKRESSRHIQVQRNFVRVNFMLLTVLIFCNMPSAVVATIRFFAEDNAAAPSVKTLIANLMVDNLLYLKFLLDPFVYAWRVPKYREAFYKSIGRQGTVQTVGRSHDNNTTSAGKETNHLELSRAPSHPSNGSTVTLLSFNSLQE